MKLSWKIYLRRSFRYFSQDECFCPSASSKSHHDVCFFQILFTLGYCRCWGLCHNDIRDGDEWLVGRFQGSHLTLTNHETPSSSIGPLYGYPRWPLDGRCFGGCPLRQSPCAAGLSCHSIISPQQTSLWNPEMIWNAITQLEVSA